MIDWTWNVKRGDSSLDERKLKDGLREGSYLLVSNQRALN